MKIYPKEKSHRWDNARLLFQTNKDSKKKEKIIIIRKRDKK